MKNISLLKVNLNKYPKNIFYVKKKHSKAANISTYSLFIQHVLLTSSCDDL